MANRTQASHFAHVTAGDSTPGGPPPACSPSSSLLPRSPRGTPRRSRRGSGPVALTPRERIGANAVLGDSSITQRHQNAVDRRIAQLPPRLRWAAGALRLTLQEPADGLDRVLARGREVVRRGRRSRHRDQSTSTGYRMFTSASDHRGRAPRRRSSSGCGRRLRTRFAPEGCRLGGARRAAGMTETLASLMRSGA